ncbi:MAG: hypothetical protein H0W68_08365 [Gemmatimonadaceae bacterium]|nr:hypothetical protein [Gemmatimonadaceae bacterium]
MRLVASLMFGLTVGYSFGYRQADAGQEHLGRVALDYVGIKRARDKVREDHEARQRRVDELRQARADSIESVIHRTSAP